MIEEDPLHLAAAVQKAEAFKDAADLEHNAAAHQLARYIADEYADDPKLRDADPETLAEYVSLYILSWEARVEARLGWVELQGRAKRG